MKWLVDNWALIVVILCAIGVVWGMIKRFTELPSDQQLEKVRVFLLACVIEAEKIFGEKTGQLKLSWVYSEFAKVFPSLVPIIPFEEFSALVDVVLKKMENMIESNEEIKKYIYGDESRRGTDGE